GGRDDRRTALTSFVQFTDLHLVDAQSPARVEYVHPFIGSAHRPHETLSTQGAAALVKRVNGLVGPYTGRQFDFVLCTGDNTDNHETIELDWFLTVLNGGTVTPNTGDPARFEGVQNSRSTLYWNPGYSGSDMYKDKGFPVMPDLLANAIKPFRSPGLNRPWYSVFGNHDDSVQGSFPSVSLLDGLYTGSLKIEGFASEAEAANLAKAMHWYSDGRWMQEPWAEIFAFGVAAAQALGNRPDEAKLLNFLGWAEALCLGDNRSAYTHHEQALRIAVDIDDRQEQAWAHAYMSGVQMRENKPEQALESIQQACDVAFDLGFWTMQVSLRNRLGRSLQALARYEEALAVHETLLVDCAKHRDETSPDSYRWISAMVQLEVGGCLGGLGKWRAAAETYAQTREAFARSKMRPREADAVLFHYAKSDDESAVDSLYVEEAQKWFNSVWETVTR
ncbi:hypothetical protein ACFQ1S_21720, partial [Kibdelosporangium lantanae]